MHVLAVVVALALAAPTASAAPSGAQPDCGDLVTRDVTLESDLSCDKGLELAPGVTLDLGGHRVVGQAAHSGIGIVGPQAGHATVRNGEVGGWAFGIAADRGGTMHVEGVSVGGSAVGIQAVTAQLTLVDSVVRGGYTGLTCRGRCDVRSTTFDGSEDDVGLDCSGGTCTVTSSTFVDLDVAARGISYFADNVVRTSNWGVIGVRRAERNQFLSCPAFGVVVTSPGATVVDNVFQGNYMGLSVDAPGTPTVQVVANLFLHNTVGLQAVSPVEIARNVAAGNEVALDAPQATATDWNVGLEP